MAEKKINYNVGYRFHCNLETGSMELWIDYHSPPDESFEAHEKKHWDYAKPIYQLIGEVVSPARELIEKLGLEEQVPIIRFFREDEELYAEKLDQVRPLLERTKEPQQG